MNRGRNSREASSNKEMVSIKTAPRVVIGLRAGLRAKEHPIQARQPPAVKSLLNPRKPKEPVQRPNGMAAVRRTSKRDALAISSTAASHHKSMASFSQSRNPSH